MNNGVDIKIVISLFVGVLILLGIYLLIDLHIIKFDDENNSTVEENAVIIDENPIGPQISNESVSPVNSEENNNETTEDVVAPEKPVETVTSEQKEEIKEPEIDKKGTISFDNKKIECYENEEVNVVISASYVQSINTQASVKSYTSSNTKIATITKHPTLEVDCVGCVAVKVRCVSAGKTTLKAKSSTGAEATASVVVKKIPAGNISFGKDSFECLPGQKFTTNLTVTSNNTKYVDGIKSYQSSDPSVASLTPSDVQPRCTGCIALDIKCLKPGTTTFSAATNYGSNVSVKTTVNNDIGTISFDKNEYSCTEGDTITFKVNARKTVTNNEANSSYYNQKQVSVSSITAGDKTLVSLKQTESSSSDSKVNVTCKKAGKTSLTAVSNLGATATSSITVKAASSSIAFTPSVISCNAGKTVSVQVKYNPTNNTTFSIDNTGIASVSKSTIQFDCTDCVSLDIKCIKQGNATLKFKLINDFERSLNIVVK